MLYKSFWPSGFEMRAKLTLAALVGLILCGVATLETPEFLKLVDNTSNDFSLLGTQQEASSEVVRQSLEVQPKAGPTTERSERPRVRRRAAGSSYPTKDILHFLCIMRT